MDESSPTQNRKSRRSNVFMKASIEQSGQAREVKLRNLSHEGALIESDDLPVEGTELLFVKGELRVPARVAWNHDGHAGLAFNKHLDPVQVLHHIPAPKARVAAKFRRPGLAMELTESERKFGETWLYGRPLPPVGE